jgi:hypothetical protein
MHVIPIKTAPHSVVISHSSSIFDIEGRKKVNVAWGWE